MDGWMDGWIEWMGCAGYAILRQNQCLQSIIKAPPSNNPLHSLALSNHHNINNFFPLLSPTFPTYKPIIIITFKPSLATPSRLSRGRHQS